jgi:hypothetical protein
MEILHLMEIEGKKVWLCVNLEKSNGIYMGYFSSVVEEIKTYVAAFIRCPAAQVYYWLKRKGCLGKDVNLLICKCFTVEQQQKVTKSKYIKEKGFAIVKDSNKNDIINVANNSGLFDMSLGLSDKEQRNRMVKTSYNDLAITFGDAKAGSMEAYNFSSEASITTLHKEREGKGVSVALAETIAKSVFRIATDDTSNEDGEADTNDEETDVSSTIEIDGMEMVELEAQCLTDNMNCEMAQLQLSSEDSQLEDSKSEEEDDTYLTGNTSTEEPSAHELDLEDYDDALEVSSGELDAVHANKLQMPENFKQQPWNEAGPTVNNMMIQLNLIKGNLKDNKAGMPFEWVGVSKELRLLLVEEAGEGISDQITYINAMLVELYQMNPSGVRNFDPLSEELDKDFDASKTQGTSPGAQEARPVEEAAMPDARLGRDKEGVQSLGMATGD